MKTEAEIYLEYEKALSQTETLMQLAAEINSSVAGDTKETTAALETVWKGEEPSRRIFTMRRCRRSGWLRQEIINKERK